MKTIIQRVTSAKVTVDEELLSSIGKGICVLVGFCKTDTEKDVDYMTRKVLSLRLFHDDEGKRWKKSVKDNNFEILCVSQFTLYGRLNKNKPDFRMSMEGERANELYKSFLTKLATLYEPSKIKDGAFGAYMQVHINNDGPVTIEIESPTLNEET
ncbi:D-aminoacyl-tRNA deacylase isoform X1 [Eupeodes corollae]|uniref:D-aminoacyl-tRNA deacylase isoform X1 n=1 Tax=Eupeodes corollae TaxID=290404 RepID=UPI0024936001|nr:D-aminoacyl-tRNA deacylase isoform X1 [Eupeodes corollae]